MVVKVDGGAAQQLGLRQRAGKTTNRAAGGLVMRPRCCARGEGLHGQGQRWSGQQLLAVKGGNDGGGVGGMRRRRRCWSCSGDLGGEAWAGTILVVVSAAETRWGSRRYESVVWIACAVV
jgi:hypothetical protein